MSPRKFLSIAIVVIVPFICHSQIYHEDWVESDDTSFKLSAASNFSARPVHYRTFEVPLDRFILKLKEVEQEIIIPDPDGRFQTYVISPSFINAPEVAKHYTIKTFMGYKKSDPRVKIACDISTIGFNAAVYDGSNTFFISALSPNGASKHMS